MSRRTNLLADSAVSVGEAVGFPSGNGAAARAPRAFGRTTPRVRRETFPATMPLGQFLFEYLYRRGVRHSFGVPGDFALPTFTWLEKSEIRSITMTHEPAAGFAADAYSRINGIGLVCVTYCVGGLNVLNAIAGAYAEKSPVVVVSGAPGRKDREKRSAASSQGQNFRNAAPHL
jgi:indolepyruvate decarboxylase